MSVSFSSAGWPAITADAGGKYTSEDFMSIPSLSLNVTLVSGRGRGQAPAQISARRKRFVIANYGSFLRTHFGNGMDQMRRGTAKQARSVSRGARSRLRPEKITVGWRIPERRTAGKSLRIPAKTKDMHVSNSTDML